MRKRTTLGFLAAAPLLALAACGDDEGTGGAGGSTSSATTTGSNATGTTTTTTTTGSTSSSSSTGGGGGGGEPFVTPTPIAVPLSPAGPDQLQSVTAASNDGDFLAAGFAAAAVGGPRLVTVVKYSSAGPDASFGTGGVATTDVTFMGGADEIDVATQSDGKIVVSATVANAVNANDRDIALIRLNADGSLDTTFGTNGVTVVNLNDAYDNGMMLVGLDAARSLTVDGDDNIFVHAASRALGNAQGGGPRTDTDFTVVKLTQDGDVDTTFGDAGQFRLDIAQVNGTPRAIAAIADGSLIASGYANTPDVGDTVQAVLYKVTPNGELDDAFATSGLFHEPVLTIQTEIYGFALHGPSLVTGGYGRNTGDTNDYVSMRFDVDTGARDTTWGDTNGAVVVDPSGTMLGSNARNTVGLPDGGTIILGSTGPANMPEQDAVFVVLDDAGELDTAYGTGIHVLPLGNDGNDQLWGGAVSGSFVSLVGYQGGGQTQTDTTNDDSYVVVFEAQ
ncbi:MAG: hypothetical protein JNL21_04055 [Myxococcales bacterium]|nr:hypothetical protein [Myxococcales bacterium]